jgi:hypothetical protein
MYYIAITHLLQQNSVVSLEGLEDVMVRPPGSHAVDSGIPVATAALTANRERVLRVIGCVCLEPCIMSRQKSATLLARRRCDLIMTGHV